MTGSKKKRPTQAGTIVCVSKTIECLLMLHTATFSFDALISADKCCEYLKANTILSASVLFTLHSKQDV